MSAEEHNLLSVAKKWVVGREIELLRFRVHTAVEAFEDSDSYDSDLRGDLEEYADELQDYSSAMADIPTPILMRLLAEFLA